MEAGIIDQGKPLAPASSFRFRSDEDETLPVQLRLRERSYLKCCGCVTAVLLIIMVTFLVLGFTVFHVKEPKVNMNRIEVQRLEFYPNGTLRTDVNVTLLADVSIKNPNMAPFKFKEGVTTVYYGGGAVGEGRTPAGKAGARRTFHMNATMDVVPERLLGVGSGFMSEVGSTRLMNMTSYTVIRGKVNLLGVIKKYVVVRVNCSMSIDGKNLGASVAPTTQYNFLLNFNTWHLDTSEI